jgi:hypothetical protein
MIFLAKVALNIFASKIYPADASAIIFCGYKNLLQNERRLAARSLARRGATHSTDGRQCAHYAASGILVGLLN